MFGGSPMKFGLVEVGFNEEYLSLSNVKVSVGISNLTSNVETVFTYKNQFDRVAEAKFVFPLNDAAVYQFEAEIEDRKIIAECRPRNEAQTTYDSAIAKGHTAFISHQDERCEDIFQMSIGHVPIGATVLLRLKYVGSIEAENVNDDDTHKSRAIFLLPSVINPRYTPQESGRNKEFEPLQGLTWNSVPYTISFQATLLMPAEIVSVTSERDKYILDVDPTNPRSARVKLESGFKPDHALQMIIKMNGRLQSFALLETGDVTKSSILAQSCLMVQFMPDFSSAFNEQELRTELIFVIDRSGSMSGSSIRSASESLLLFLKSLPIGCRFQIIGFGSTHSALFNEPVDYNEQSLQRALQYQESLQADMGGTELLAALGTAYDSPLTGQGWYKQIILLTDGDVGNADEVIGLVRSNVHKARLFTIGIGLDVNNYLFTSVARAGRGVTTFIRQNSEMRAAVMKILDTALQPRATPCRVDWNLKRQCVPVDVTSTPSLPPSIFIGCYTTIFGLIDGDSSDLGGEINMVYEVLGTEHTMTVPITSSGAPSLESTDDAPIHRLAAKSLLNELSDQHKALKVSKSSESGQESESELQNLRAQIEQISCSLSIISPFTSFVGVDPVKHEPALVLSTPTPYDEVDCAPLGFSQPMLFGASCPPMGDPQSLMGSVQGTQSSFGFDIEMEQCSDDGLFSVINTNNGTRKKMKRGFAHNALFAKRSFPAPSAPPMAFCCGTTAQPLSGGPLFGAPESEQLQESTALLKLVKMQHFIGSWSLDKDLCECTGLSPEAVRVAKPIKWSASTDLDLSEAVWATVVALAYLEIKESENKDEWMLIARKARQWIQNEAKLVLKDSTVVTNTFNELMQKAKKLFTDSQSFH